MSAERKTCPTCQNPLAAGARECPRCHTRVAAASPLTGGDPGAARTRLMCEFHPDRPALNHCGGCQKPLCSACEIGILGQSYCQRCIYVYVDLPQVFERLAQESAQRIRLARDQERIVGELRIAHQMQARMLPQSPPAVAGVDVAGFSEPCREVGGDYFDYWALPDGKLALCIGDVTGKGVPASLLMAMVKSCLFTLSSENPAPGPILGALGSMVRSLGDRNQLMTFLFGVVDPARRTLRFGNAGHLYPYLLRASEGTITFLEANGLPLGAPFDLKYNEVEYALQPEDCIIFSTDGIVEAHNTAGEMLGFERLQEIVRGTRGLDSHGAIHTILSGLRKFAGQAPLADDVTLVVVRLTHSPAIDSKQPVEAHHAAV
ncbi:MAG TPA: SpoIIE family protein phosphatase [Armatimonadota bacterium]|nr:SpoIIE family protein phosphatase [Armatimonadota bacterium]